MEYVLHYAESGSGNNLVLLLHGFPEFWYSWRHQLKALGKSYRVVAPDMRGYNLSDKPSRVKDYRIDILVDDVIGLIQHFGASKAAIVGHDWGGGVAWAVAQKYPEHVTRLAVLQVPPASVWRANITLKQLLRSWYMFFFQLPRIPEWLISRNNFTALERVLTEKVHRRGSFTGADIQCYKEAWRQRGAMTAAVNYYRANVFRVMRKANPAQTHVPSSQERDSTAKQNDGRIRVPTLFIYGERDFAVLPETVGGVCSYIDASYREVRFADSGHWVQNEAVDDVNTALLNFLDSA